MGLIAAEIYVRALNIAKAIEKQIIISRTFKAEIERVALGASTGTSHTFRR